MSLHFGNTNQYFHGELGCRDMVSSKQAQAPTHDNAAYAAAKAAAEAWTLALADGFTGTGATANVVVVNAIATPEAKSTCVRRPAPNGGRSANRPVVDVRARRSRASSAA